MDTNIQGASKSWAPLRKFARPNLKKKLLKLSHKMLCTKPYYMYATELCYVSFIDNIHNTDEIMLL